MIGPHGQFELHRSCSPKIAKCPYRYTNCHIGKSIKISKCIFLKLLCNSLKNQLFYAIFMTHFFISFAFDKVFPSYDKNRKPIIREENDFTYLYTNITVPLVVTKFTSHNPVKLNVMESY